MQGVRIFTLDRGRIRIELRDGQGGVGWWDSDPDLITAGELHHVAIIVDGAPGIISFVIDGQFCDGGDSRRMGWGRFPVKRFSETLGDLNGNEAARILPLRSTGDGLRALRIYDRYLRTSEAVQNYHAGVLSRQ
jgi:hypothetical protein